MVQTTWRSTGALLLLLVIIGCAPNAAPDGSADQRANSEGQTSAPNHDDVGGDARAEQTRPRHGLPNVVVISIDTLRADHLGCYGYSRPTSPTLDRFATSGVLFEDASATSPWTLPSHASLTTGLFPSRHGQIVQRPISPIADVTLAEVLSANGYETAAYVNSMFVDRPYGFDRGFDRFRYLREDVKSELPSGVFAEAQQWLDRAHDRPFFLFLHLYDVHSNYRSLPAYEKQFVRDYDGVVTGNAIQMTLMHQTGRLDEADIHHLIDLYDAGICQLDDNLGHFLQHLDDQFEHTLVVITSDHGEEFMDHGGILHGETHYQEVIRVPLLMRGPGIPAGRRIQSVVSIVDVMPTVLTLLELDVPDGLDGVDVSQTWSTPAGSLPSRFLFSEADRGGEHDGVQQRALRWTVRSKNFKMHYDRLTKRIEMFDLAADPGETVNIVEQEAQVAAKLKSRLDAYLSRTTAPPPTPQMTEEEREKLRSLGYAK